MRGGARVVVVMAESDNGDNRVTIPSKANYLL